MYARIGEVLNYVRWIDRLGVEFIGAIRTGPLRVTMTSMTGLGSVTAGVVFVGLFYLAGWREELVKSVGEEAVLDRHPFETDIRVTVTAVVEVADTAPVATTIFERLGYDNSRAGCRARPKA